MKGVWVMMLFLHCALSEKFNVAGPVAPVVATSGSDVVLPCSVQRTADRSRLSAVDLSITWTRSDLGDALVHFYENHKDMNTRQIPNYRARTALFKEELQNGNVSLRLTDVSLRDEGEYRCRVDSEFWRDEVFFNLRVEGMKSLWVMMLFLHCALSEDFKVVGQGSPVFAAVGPDLSLSCLVKHGSNDTGMNAEDMKVMWTKGEEKVHVYENKKDNIIQQSGSYKDRTRLDKEALKKGDASLKLSNIKASDMGTYKCTVESGGKKKDVTVEVTEKFKVISPGSPVSVTLGYNVILPCFVQRENDQASMNAEDMKVTWTKSGTTVHVYENKKDDLTQQSGSYTGRTALYKGALRKGDVSLSLALVKGSDNGKFKCTVKSGRQEKEVEVDLQVKATGTYPEITVMSLQCKSKGWLPAPEVEWRDNNGSVLTGKLTKKERDDKLFNVESRIDVMSGDVFHCRVKQNHIIKEEKIKPYETCVSWKAAVGGLAAVLLLAVIVCVIKAKAR
ncbi:hypothetical protein AOLI_G00153120 [Acnodon oligacanthus]